MIKRHKRMIALLILALTGVFLIGYMISLTVHFQMYGGGQGFEKFREFISQPGDALGVLFFGNETGNETAEGQKIHDLFLGGWQWIYWSVVLGLLALTYFRKRQVVKKASDYGSHRTARWATLRKILGRVPADGKGIVLGTYKGSMLIHPVASHLNQFVVVFGGSGSGKSTGRVIPNILQVSRHLGESIVVTDTKGELYNATA